MTVGIAIITYNSEKHIEKCLCSIPINSVDKLIVFDSSSKDSTCEIVSRYNLEVKNISYNDYNHGLTRDFARKYLATDIVVFLTPDASFVKPEMFEDLISVFQDSSIAVAYARQLPKPNANFFESFLRAFNYPRFSQIRSYRDSNLYGSYIFFNSNSCSAYRNELLDKVEGFGETIVGEDQIAAAKLLKKGYQIAYVAESLVYHSHSFSLIEEFQRYFDIGIFRKRNRLLFNFAQNDYFIGFRYAIKLMYLVFRNEPRKIIYAILHLFMKYFGYLLGTMEKAIPLFLKKRFSKQKFYW